MTLTCGCALVGSTKPVCIATSRRGSHIIRRLSHDCGKRWRQIEVRDTDEERGDADA